MRLSQSLFGFTALLAFPLVFATVSFSTSTAQARENHCDHSRGKARGTIIGGLLGAGAGLLAGHGSTGGALIGGGAGALAGRAIGDGEDDRHDMEDCGTDSESYQRQVDREDDRFDRAEARSERRQYEISRDRRDARMRRSAPRLMYQCQNLGRGRFGVIDLRQNRVIEIHGRDLASCEDSADYYNGY